MTSRLITTWSDHDRAVDEILALSPGALLVFDEDLSPLKLERPQRMATLRSLLSARQAHTRLTIVVQQTDFVRQHSPQLMQLLTDFAPALTIVHAAPQLATLKDSLLIADGRHVLVRFHRDHPRARLIIDDVAACAPWLQRFEEILREGGDLLSPTTLGL